MRDVGTRGEVADVEGATHVVDGEEGEDSALHVGHGDGDDGELLLALDGDFVCGGIGPKPHLRLRPIIRGDAHVWRGELGVVVESKNGTGTSGRAAKRDSVA